MGKTTDLLKESMAILVAVGGMSGMITSDGNPAKMADIQSDTLSNMAEVLKAGENTEAAGKESSLNNQVTINN